MPEMSCKHANQFFTQKTNEIAYKNIINHLAFPKSKREFTHKASLYCALCKTRGEDFDVCNKDLIRPRCLLACAHCIHFACWDYRHIYLHREDHPDHYLCLSNRYWRPSFNELRLIPHITPVLPLTVNGCSGAMRGLINMGNTCFLNVVIQALTHTPVLRDYLLADLHRCSSPTRSRNCLACEMVRITQEHNSKVIKETPKIINSTECIPQPDSNSQASSVSSSRESSDSCDCIVHQVFFGDLESVISYEGCEHRSSTVDPFLDLSLDVIQRGSTSLQACLGSYFRPELIDGLIWCSQCNIGRPAVKQFSLLHLPNVLCFYLKRCHHDTKINTSITFPVELDMAPYLHQIVGDQSAWYDKYSLYAVLNHSGQTNSGHYTAYIRVGPGAWCLCDDQKVVSVNLNDVLHTDAYVLLYHKNLLAVRI
ncbi:ubiquitin carboxyl-terminal hydrolase 22/27/51 [Schistosoma bovis]|uniref:Ubiquitin carboxyl-terminal hydrolase n=2 Tax=Schistosoma bovis TaxID=6184 RepID=A0A430QCC0_SCHBO|nr:ubiquitin carboxyl-terminal hydrolase 22/27/51 [Schistosoma bovis]